MGSRMGYIRDTCVSTESLPRDCTSTESSLGISRPVLLHPRAMDLSHLSEKFLSAHDFTDIYILLAAIHRLHFDHFLHIRKSLVPIIVLVVHAHHRWWVTGTMIATSDRGPVTGTDNRLCTSKTGTNFLVDFAVVRSVPLPFRRPAVC